MGIPSNRVVGAERILRQRAQAARDKAATLDPDSQFAASLRGKAAAYDEGADLMQRLDKGARLDRAHRWGIRKPKATRRVTATCSRRCSECGKYDCGSDSCQCGSA